MRDIKFRAWDDNKNEMLAGSELADLFMLGYVISDNCMRIKVGSPETGRPISLMQYTGLEDKNGVEIYEGDIVQKRIDGVNLDGDERTSSIVSQVVFDSVEARFGLDKGEDDGSVYALYGDSPEDVEVIGNIYENPELLVATSQVS